MPLVLFDDLDVTQVWGWLEPVHDGARRPLMGAEATIGRVDLESAVGEEDAKVSKHHFKVTSGTGGAFIIDISSNGTFLNGERLKKETAVALCHADLITLADATRAKFAFRFCEADRKLPALGQTVETPRGNLGRKASMAAEIALLDAKQAEVDEWVKVFERENGRKPQHAEKLSALPSYKVLLRLKRQQRRQQWTEPDERGKSAAVRQ